MKRLLLCLLMTPLLTISCAQTQREKVEVPEQNAKIVYEIYPTSNMWNFIKLNTRNGKMWQVQYSIKDENRFETYLNETSLVTGEKEVNGRFKLHPTQNIYTFILLDQIDGKTWQVQWSFEEDKRFIVPIE